jgi:hypothetical protein
MKSHPDGFGGGGKSSTRTPLKEIKRLMRSLLRIIIVNVKTETTFHDYSSS